MAPAATPQEIVARLHADIARVLALSEVRERLASQGVEVVASTPAELAAFIQADIAKYAKLVRSAGIKID